MLNKAANSPKELELKEGLEEKAKLIYPYTYVVAKPKYEFLPFLLLLSTSTVF